MSIKLRGALIALSMFMVVGTFLSKSAHAECREGEERTTTTGAIFTCDTSHPALGEAWRDRDGLIWGDVVKKADGIVHYMVHSEATNYCTSIGARLPSKEEFIQLREYMGAQSGTHEGYSPQVLPNLSDHWSSWYWSSSVALSNSAVLNDSAKADIFLGPNGDILSDFIYFIHGVRCLVSR